MGSPPALTHCRVGRARTWQDPVAASPSETVGLDGGTGRPRPWCAQRVKPPGVATLDGSGLATSRGSCSAAGSAPNVRSGSRPEGPTSVEPTRRSTLGTVPRDRTTAAPPATSLPADRRSRSGCNCQCPSRPPAVPPPSTSLPALSPGLEPDSSQTQRPSPSARASTRLAGGRPDESGHGGGLRPGHAQRRAQPVAPGNDGSS